MVIANFFEDENKEFRAYARQGAPVTRSRLRFSVALVGRGDRLCHGLSPARSLRLIASCEVLIIHVGS